jgi:ribonuclease HI
MMTSATMPPDNKQPAILEMYTDGACSGNPGPGGWGTLIQFANGQVHELGAADPATTNNRMELQAAIAALQYWQDYTQNHPQKPAVDLYTDSEYVKNGITQWINGWKKRGWKNAQGKPVANQDLWQKLDALNSPKVNWKYVRGHAGNPGNERCDTIAQAFSKGYPPQLRQTSVIKS